LIPPAMFAILSCLTCILFLVILAATSRTKRPVAGSPRSPRAKVAQGFSRAVSHSDSAGTLPLISPGLDSKAVMKVASSGARRETPLPSSPVALKPLGDRKAQPMMSLPAGVLSAVSEKTDGSAAASPDSTASAIAAVPVGAGSSKTSDENISQYRAASSEDTPQEEIKAPLPVQEASAVAASAPAVVERAEVAQTAPVAASGDNSADCGPVVAPVEDPSAAGGTAIPSVAATAAAQTPAENPGEGERSRGSRVATSDEEVRAPSLLAFYGLKQQPFDVTPDPAYLYRSRVHREAFHAISQGVENLRGFVALVAEPGMGKTTLLNKLMEELNGSARVVFLCQTQCNSSELLRHLLTELGVEHEGGDRVAMHKVLNQALFEEMLQGRRFVLIVDEAQNLQDSVLETIRMLSNYETTHSKMIQIVLAGQPQLVETLMRPSLVQLRQRIAVLANLEPLDAPETAEYIEHRLRAAGSGDVPIFTAEAMTLIAERSQGIPRSINNICFNAMLAGYMNRLLMIDCEIVEKVASRLDLELLARPPRQEPVSVPAAAPSSELSQLANLLSSALTAQVRPEVVETSQAKDGSESGLALLGRLNEKVTSQSWSNKNEFQIQVSLERDYLPGIPIADHYYCRSFYVSEDQAKRLQPGKAVRVRFEQD